MCRVCRMHVRTHGDLTWETGITTGVFRTALNVMSNLIGCTKLKVWSVAKDQFRSAPNTANPLRMETQGNRIHPYLMTPLHRLRWPNNPQKPHMSRTAPASHETDPKH